MQEKLIEDLRGIVPDDLLRLAYDAAYVEGDVGSPDIVNLLGVRYIRASEKNKLFSEKFGRSCAIEELEGGYRFSQFLYNAEWDDTHSVGVTVIPTEGEDWFRTMAIYAYAIQAHAYGSGSCPIIHPPTLPLVPAKAREAGLQFDILPIEL